MYIGILKQLHYAPGSMIKSCSRIVTCIASSTLSVFKDYPASRRNASPFNGSCPPAVFHAGPSTAMHWIQTGNAGSISNAGTRPGGDQMNGNAVMYHTGKIVTFGGGPDYESKPATKATSIITLSGVAASAKASTPMHFERAFCSAVALPDGKVVVFGGMPFPIAFDDTNGVMPTGTLLHKCLLDVTELLDVCQGGSDGSQLLRAGSVVHAHAPCCSVQRHLVCCAFQVLVKFCRACAEIFDPEKETWTLTDSIAVPRTYHSVAVLLQDGRVFSGGGGLCGGCNTNHFDGQIFTPPNLLNAGGGAAARPTITVSSATATNGNALTVTANSVLLRISLIRRARDF